MTNGIPFIIETSHFDCVIHERNSNLKRVEIRPGEVTPTQIKSIAYQLLAMVGE